MLFRRIDDWDDAYANGPHIPDGAHYLDRWAAAAAAFREKRPPEVISYGPHEREALDLFLPDAAPEGLVVFVHGGYWLRFDRSFWSHLASGPLARGWAVAMPSYPLCPEVRVSAITRSVARAVETASGRVEGPLRLAGHSAGGHLVTRMVCHAGPLGEGAAARVERVVSISGVHDLRPLTATEIGTSLQLDAAEAAAESPALLAPVPGAEVVCWVGAGERAEFIRQNALLANAWTGLGAATACVEEADRHHFNVIDGMADPDSALVHALLD